MARALALMTYVTVPEAASLCGVSHKTIRRWIKAGKINYTMIEGFLTKYIISYATISSITGIPEADINNKLGQAIFATHQL